VARRHAGPAPRAGSVAAGLDPAVGVGVAVAGTAGVAEGVGGAVGLARRPELHAAASSAAAAPAASRDLLIHPP
jgi:hypothetical protein